MSRRSSSSSEVRRSRTEGHTEVRRSRTEEHTEVRRSRTGATALKALSFGTHREQVRERVFGALREQLYERGFEAVTLSGVAAAAGVGRSAMYNHFPDRQALLVAFVEDEAARYVADLDAVLASASSSPDRLAAFVRLQLHRLAEFHLPPGQALAGALDRQAYRRIAAHADPIGDRLLAILREGAADGSMVDEDPAVLAALVSAALSSRRIVDVGPSELDATVRTAVRAVLRMVTPPGGAQEQRSSTAAPD